MPKPDFANFKQTPEEREAGPALRQLHLTKDRPMPGALRGNVHWYDYGPVIGAELSDNRQPS